jgi:hypothetical protein
MLSHIDRSRERAAHEARKPKVLEVAADPETLAIARVFAEMRKSEALSPDDPFFANIPPSVRQDHARYIQKMRAETQKEDRPALVRDLETLASAGELVIARRINEDAWLGEGMRAQLTAEYDDRRHGMDIYVEKDGEPIGLSLDTTYTKDVATLERKIQTIKNHLLDRGVLELLEYYRPINEERRAQVAASGENQEVRLAKVIVGVHRQKMVEIIKRYHNRQPAKPDAPAGLIMLYQIKLQLEHFMKYSKHISAKGKPWAEKAVSAYEDILKEIGVVWNDKLRSLNLDEKKSKGTTHCERSVYHCSKRYPRPGTPSL